MFEKLKELVFEKYWWQLKSYQFNLLFALWTLVFYNANFWGKFAEIAPSTTFAAGGTACLVVLAFAGSMILMFRYTSKIWAMLFCLCNAGVWYFMDSYHVAIDKIMLLNTIETDLNETGEIFSFHMVYYFLIGFVLPMVLVAKTKIVYQPLKVEILKRFLLVLVSFLIVAGIVFSGYKTTAQFMRNNRHLRYLLVPVNYIGAVISVVKIKKKAMHTELIKIGEDAQMVRYWQNKDKRNLLVLVVGETARAMNFSLNGYGRKTDEPLLKYRSEILNFSNTSSCGTSTAISLPCMFSHAGRERFNAGESDYTENLLDVAQRAGYKVWWRENNSGCKKVCARVETEKMCANGECLDQILLKDFAKQIRGFNQDSLVVLHQMGSHGPTYYKRYPKEDEKYTPICDTERLDTCSQEEIVNVYDNGIAYTSKNLAGVIEELKSLSKEYNVVMIYMSDHGESLGENNIYLHAAPYMIAPKEQTAVPFMIWFDEATAKNLRLNRQCLLEKQDDKLSQDNLFHLVLGLLGVKTTVYDEHLDILADCRMK